MSDTITQTMLNKRYDHWATQLLAESLKQNKTARGKVRTYTILKPLPNPQDYDKIRNKHFTASVSSQVSEAFSEFSTLNDELDDWYNNLPEQFQQGEKGSEIEEATGVLSNLSEPDVPDCISELEVCYIPHQGDSRSDRCSNAIGALRMCIEVLQGWVEEDENKDNADEVNSFIDELDNVASEAESVNFPGMY